MSIRQDRKYVGEYANTLNGVEYNGKWYTYEDAAKAKTAAKKMTIIAAAQLLIFVAGLIYDSAASYKVWVFIPYVLAFLPYFYLAYQTFSVFRHKGDYTHKEYDRLIGGQKGSIYAVLVFMSISLVTDVILLILGAAKLVTLNIIWDILFTIGLIILVILDILNIKLTKCLSCKTK